MTNKDIEEMKRNIDELVEGLKKQEDENARLKATVKSQRDKIDSLLKELKEEKGKDNYHFRRCNYHESRYVGSTQ